MKRSLELTVHNRLADHLAGKSTLDDFKSWLVVATWDTEQTLASSETRIINEIKLALAEHSGGYGTDEELRETLKSILNSIGITAEMVG